MRLKPDELDASEAAFRPFTLPPFDSIYMLVTSPTVFGAEQDALRLRYSMLGFSRTSDVSFAGPVTVERFSCP